MRTAKIKAMIVTICLLGLVGCTEPDANAQAFPPSLPYSEKTLNIDIDTSPAKTDYTGEGRKYTRYVESWRSTTPFGVAPGEVIGSQKPMNVDEPGSPAVEVTPQGIGVKAQEGRSKFTGGSSDVSIFARIWAWISDVFWFIVIILIVIVLFIVGCTVLYFLVPATRPIFNIILRILASIFPFLGSLVEKTVGETKVAIKEAELLPPLTETVSGGQAFKNAIDLEPVFDPLSTLVIDPTAQWSTISDKIRAAIAKADGFTDSQKADIRQMFNTTMATKQSPDSIATVKAIKATL